MREHHDVHADEAHVVRQRHPREVRVVFAPVRRLTRTARVLENVVVREDDAFRLAGRAGRELDERGVAGFDGVDHACLRDVVDLLGEEGARVERIERRLFAGAAGERADAIERLAVRVDERPPEFLRDAQQLVFVLVADAERHGHRHDAAQHAGPECIEELLVVGEIDDELVAGPGAELLQVVKDAECALVQLAVAHHAFAGFGLEVTDGAFHRAIDGDQFGECLCVRDHLDQFLRSSVIIKGYLVRRLICASSSSSRSGTYRSRYRRATLYKCMYISYKARVSPMQCRGPAAKGM